MTIPDRGVWDKPEGQERGLPAALRGLGGHISAISQDWVLIGVVILTGSLCFGLGVLAVRANPPEGDSLWIEQLPKEELPGSIGTSTQAAVSDAEVQQGGGASPSSALPVASQPAAAAAALSPAHNYVASKTGTKYYLPTCGTAKRIKDENKVWFATKADAEKAGYGPSTSCKGL